MSSTFAPRTILLLLIITAAATLRLLTHFTDHLSAISNFTPIGALALFGGASLKGRIKPLFFPLLTLFVSDVVLSFTVYANFRSGLLYAGWYWTYAAFALMAIAGKLLVKNVNVKTMLLGVFGTTVIHWLVSDIGGCIDEKTATAMLSLYGQRLITAIPYEWSFFAGTLIYGGVMFGSFEWLQEKYPQISMSPKDKTLAS